MDPVRIHRFHDHGLSAKLPEFRTLDPRTCTTLRRRLAGRLGLSADASSVDINCLLRDRLEWISQPVPQTTSFNSKHSVEMRLN